MDEYTYAPAVAALDSRLTHAASQLQVEEDFNRVLGIHDLSNATITAELETIVNDLKENISFTVTFNSDGGSSVDNQTVKYLGKATEPEDPTKASYTFVGWFLGEATEAFNFETVLHKAITLKAHWEAAEE